MNYEIKITPLSERQAIIQKRLENATKTGDTIYDFRSGNYTPKVISLEINVPVYRMENCRTFSEQQNEIAIKGLENTHFSKGQELTSVQSAQHTILAKLSERGTKSVSPIMDVLMEEGQREPILISNSGVVINGNRRLSAMRELYRKKDGSVDQRFSHIECAVLPPDATADEIDDIEATLQARPQTKLDYDWIGDARLVRRQVNKGRSTKEVADQLRRSKAEIENVLQALDEADLYLSEWAVKPGQYAIISGDAEQIFADIPKKIANKDSNLQDASRAIAWTLFENKDQIQGRIYSFNSAFGKLAPQVLDSMEDQLDIDINDSPNDSDLDDDFAIDIDDVDDGPDYLPIINALRNDETKDDAIQILLEVCESEIERDKGQKSEKAALRALSQVNAKLTGIDIDTAGKQTLSAMLKQIESIQKLLTKIEGNIVKRQTAGSDKKKSG